VGIALLFYGKEKPILLIKVCYNRSINVYKRCRSHGCDMNTISALAIVAAVVVVMGSVAVTLAPEADARVDQRNRNSQTLNTAAVGGLLAIAASVGVQAGNVCVLCQ
jgi:hypothetical protein